MGVYSVHLVGESNYQQAIRNLFPGAPVTLEHEQSNKHSDRAIRCLTEIGETVGYLEEGSWLTRAMLDDGTAASATVEDVIGGQPGNKFRGVVLEVRTGADAAGEASAGGDLAPRRLSVGERAAAAAAQSAGVASAEVPPRYQPAASSLSTEQLQLVETRLTNEGPSSGVAWLLLIFLGFLAAHRFYLGRTGTAILMIVSMFFLIGFLWWFLDLFLLSGMIRARRGEIRQKLIWQAEGQLPR